MCESFHETNTRPNDEQASSTQIHQRNNNFPRTHAKDLDSLRHVYNIIQTTKIAIIFFLKDEKKNMCRKYTKNFCDKGQYPLATCARRLFGKKSEKKICSEKELFYSYVPGMSPLIAPATSLATAPMSRHPSWGRAAKRNEHNKLA
jgi:hypothetical protein